MKSGLVLSSRLLLLVQYAAMFVSAGEAGDAKKVQTSVAAARKVFRIFRVSMLCISRQAKTSQACLAVHCFGTQTLCTASHT